MLSNEGARLARVLEDKLESEAMDARWYSVVASIESFGKYRALEVTSVESAMVHELECSEE